MPPTIRETTAADLPRLIPLLAQLAPQEPEREGAPNAPEYAAALAAITRTPGQHVFVLEDGGRLLGSVALSITPNITHRGAPYAIIENMVVDEGVRSRGYGELLIRRAIETARAAGCYRVSLTSNKRRTDAHRFYERAGFQRTHEAFRLDL